MSDSEVSKMKVADLKRELKLRGLPTTGNKNELQERLQTALLDGELSLEDTAISGEDLLDDDVLTDEEKDILSDEKELLKSPTTEKDSILDSPVEDVSSPTENLPPKKIILKRKISITSITAATPAVTKEDSVPTAEKVLKMSERNPITALDDTSSAAEKTTSTTESNEEGKPVKVSQLTMKERLELRAKKFGITETKTVTTDESTKTASAATTPAPVQTDVKDEKQVEALKKRAERFGCVVSPTMTDIKEAERLQKRKERFGVSEGGDSKDKETVTSGGSDAYAEKARLRLERFKTTAAQ